ncbi:MAG TPA: hypothetical protein ENN07_06000, partial [candidate division Zixibacteria bacterium]|nr:hypothetical protein [candidate division Zixibacteria bacterium]
MKKIFLAIIFLAMVALAFEPDILPHAEHHRDFGGQWTPTAERAVVSPKRERPHSALTHEVYGFIPYWEYPAYIPSRFDLISRVAYFNITLDGAGNVSHNYDWPANSLIAAANSAGVPVDLCVAVFNEANISSIVNNPANRTNAIRNICTQMSLGADGVNIDFELPRESDAGGFYAFLRELADSVKTRWPDKWVSVCLPPVDWSRTFDADSLLPHLDALFLMGYGYHWRTGPTTGPVAPLDDPLCTFDIVRSINDYCGSDSFKRSRFIMGLPLYGYDWPCVSPFRGASTTGAGTAKFYRTAVAESLLYTNMWDSNAPAPWYYYDSYRQCWWDDARSLDVKYRRAVAEGLMGVGFWALGYDDHCPAIWNGVQDVFGGGVSGDSIIVNDTDAEFDTGGSWSDGTFEGGWDGDYKWCNAPTDDERWARWAPYLPEAGEYSVYMWWLAGGNRCDNVRVRISGVAEGSVFVSQKGSGARWHYLGNYDFHAGWGGHVRIDNGTAINGTVVIADAVLWIYSGPLDVEDKFSTPSAFNIHVFPNPFNSSVTITIDGVGAQGLAPLQHLSVEIY